MVAARPFLWIVYLVRARLQSLCENLDFHKVPIFDNEVKSFTFTKSGIRKSCGNRIFSSFHTDSSAPEVTFDICRCVFLHIVEIGCSIPKKLLCRYPIRSRLTVFFPWKVFYH